MAGEAAQLRTFDVTSKDAAAYGYEKPEAMKNQVTVADALYVLHKTMYGDAFDENPSKYLNVGSNGWIYAMLENTTGNFGYYVNNKYPVDENNCIKEWRYTEPLCAGRYKRIHRRVYLF